MRFGSSKKAKPSRSCCLEKRAFSIFRLKVGVLTFQNDCIRLIGLLILREISFLRSIFPFQKKLAGKKKEEEEEEEEEEEGWLEPNLLLKPLRFARSSFLLLTMAFP